MIKFGDRVKAHGYGNDGEGEIVTNEEYGYRSGVVLQVLSKQDLAQVLFVVNSDSGIRGVITWFYMSQLKKVKIKKKNGKKARN